MIWTSAKNLGNWEGIINWGKQNQLQCGLASRTQKRRRGGLRKCILLHLWSCVHHVALAGRAFWKYQSSLLQFFWSSITMMHRAAYFKHIAKLCCSYWIIRYSFSNNHGSGKRLPWRLNSSSGGTQFPLPWLQYSSRISAASLAKWNVVVHHSMQHVSTYLVNGVGYVLLVY